VEKKHPKRSRKQRDAVPWHAAWWEGEYTGKGQKSPFAFTPEQGKAIFESLPQFVPFEKRTVFLSSSGQIQVKTELESKSLQTCEVIADLSGGQ
jgi:hypothetical protein